MTIKRNYLLSILLSIAAIPVLLFAWSCEKENPVELADLSTLSVTEITSSSAKSGGNITNSGGADITSRGLVWGTTTSPTLEQQYGLTTDGLGSGIFTSNLSNLNSNTTYYVRSYAINSAGTAYGNEVQFTTSGEFATVTTANVTDISATSATSGGNITDDGGASVTARGVVWSKSQSPTLENNLGSTNNGSGTGSFISNLIGLTSKTTYYVRAYATNSVGTAYGSQVEFTTFGYDTGEWPRDIQTQVVEVTNPATGKVWMDRNLGASRAATSSTDTEAYGHLYQRGRAADGHQIRTSGTTSTLSSSDTPEHGSFITTSSWANRDWRSPQNDNLWQGVNGVNNPCPRGYRLPTAAELDAERQSWSSSNAAGAFASPLNLPWAGWRDSDGRFRGVGSSGIYWSCTVDGSLSRSLLFISTYAGMDSGYRASGFSVRCIKD